MDSLTLSKPTTANSFSAIHLISYPNFIHSHKSKFLSFAKRKPRKILVYASKDESKLDEWDKMEIKFGRMIGEDPKLTIAKIMGRKSNPDISYLEIEKLLEKRKGKGFDEEIEEIPFNVSEEEKKTITSVEGLNLVRPKLKKGLKFESTNKPMEVDKSPVNRPIMNAKKETTSSVPNVILRKPSSFKDDDEGNEKYSRFGMRPNLSLNMGKEPKKERFSDMTLLRKPEPLTISPDVSEEKSLKYEPESSRRTDDATLLQRPELRKPDLSKEGEDESLEEYSLNSAIELQEDILSDENTLASDEPFKTVLIEKPKRLDLSSKPMDQKIKVEVSSMNRESFENQLELANFVSTSAIKECEEDDWTRAERLVKTGEREEVELISSSTKGFVASLGSLIGFLPYRNLAARWKFLAFESWLRRKGLDPSIYRQKLGIIGKYEANIMKESSELGVILEIDGKPKEEITSDMKLEDLLMIYDQEKLKFLSSFIGQRIKVGVVLADRNSRRMIFSIKPKEKEELVEKKRSLMAKLSVGDIIKCCIKKITYFGVFVEVEGVPALIHQTEVSWDTTLDPESYFKVGQIVDAKVHQLDFSLERIFLSLKEITPDPLNEALEAVVGDNNSFDGVLEAAPVDTEWDDVESLIKELEQFDGIQSVSRGRYFLSPGLAPTFQVYMASMFENQYKLLARSENRVQEVIVKTSLGKDELKSAITTCTNRVE